MRKNYLLLIAAMIIIVGVVIAFFALFYQSGVIINSTSILSNNGNLSATFLVNAPNHCSQNATFKVVLNVSSTTALTLRNISISKDFTLVSTNVSIPMTIEKATLIAITLRAPAKTHQGNLAIEFNVSIGKLERFIITDVFSSLNKSVSSFSITNNGDVPLALAEVYLVRSDGTVMNSTGVAYLQLPQSYSKEYYIDLSYSSATAFELYFIRVVTVNGITAISNYLPIACDCQH